MGVAARYWDVEARKSYYRITAKTRWPWIKKVLLSLSTPRRGWRRKGEDEGNVEKEGRKKESGQRVLFCAIFCEWDRGSPSRSPSTSKEVLILETNLLLNLEMEWWWLEIGSFIKFVSLSSLTKPFYLWISGEMILVCCKKRNIWKYMYLFNNKFFLLGFRFGELSLIFLIYSSEAIFCRVQKLQVDTKKERFKKK